MTPIRVRDVMTNLVVSFRPHDSIREVAGRLLANRISGGPVVSGGKVVGVVSEADLAGAYGPSTDHNGRIRMADPLAFRLQASPAPGWADATVSEVMTRAVVTTAPDVEVGEAARLMDRHSVRRLPVVDEDGFVCGVIARADVVRALALQWAEERETAGTLAR
ncbi:MAG TPA: CBS domain-containing protein [Actinomycetota bacterium]|nr:CBS domain-containing protein [Actinomycetota bacterium]